jgi:hypothetical protein
MLVSAIIALISILWCIYSRSFSGWY